MFGIHDLWAFLLASLLVWLTPGVDTMYIIARSISQGRQAGLVSAIGIGSGILIHTTFAAFGLSAILAASAWAFTAVKLAGAAYLIYLGVQALFKKSNLATPEVKLMSRWQIYRQGIITNVLNPKIAIFFLAFLPQFVDSRSGFGALPFLLLGILFVVGSTVWCLAIALFASSTTQTIRRNSQFAVWLERISGGVYIALGLNLLRSKLQPVS
ncbi:LysE family translocator [Microcoleus sp. FACHB-1515]|uniref:LysE family translocator n=1 Tax=Cyanophyceae TaxID=3028117 RepID=UPI001682DB75|nr:LysE family translocator [Microcoleus sp. FACHB-1515]MBD2090958.1 LysE family translocator [Microcoleus sp. FACHB-1515]